MKTNLISNLDNKKSVSKKQIHIFEDILTKLLKPIPLQKHLQNAFGFLL